MGRRRWQGGAPWPDPRARARGQSTPTLMLRLPSFTYLQPRTVGEAVAMKANAGPEGMFVAGGTDLYPNMNRRHQEARTDISLMGDPEHATRGGRNADVGYGACVTRTEIAGQSQI